MIVGVGQDPCLRLKIPDRGCIGHDACAATIFACWYQWIVGHAAPLSNSAV